MKRNNKSLLIFIAVIFSLLLGACIGNNNDGKIQFKYIALESEEDVPEFKFEMLDTGVVYTAAIVMKLAKNFKGKSVPITITITSPSGVSASETVSVSADYLDVKHYISQHWYTEISLVELATSYEVVTPYRHNISPSERGIWTFTVTPHHRQHVHGIGFKLQEFVINPDEQKR